MMKRRIVSILLIVCILAPCVYSHASAMEGVLITHVDQAVDSITYNGVTVEAIYAPYRNIRNYATSRYCCAAFVKNFYSQVFGVQVSNLIKAGGGPRVSAGSFSRTNDPQVGDILHDTSVNTHWAIVKQVNDDGTVTLIEQNAWYDYDRTQARVGKTIAVEGAGYRFYHYTPPGGSASGSSGGGGAVSVSTDSAANVTETSAVLYGSASASGSRITEVGMYLGTSSSNMSKLGSDTVSSYSPTMWYSTEKYGYPLEPGTTYYYCAYAVAGPSSAPIWGATKTFSTADFPQEAEITLNRSSMTLDRGTSHTLNATTTPTGQTVFWSSSNPTVAVVDSSGSVIGLQTGDATITASISYQGQTYSDACHITVVQPVSIELSQTSLTIPDGEAVQLTANPSPEDLTVYWTSSDTSVVIVSDSGRLIGVNAGTATISAYVNYGRDTYTATCAVTVVPSVQEASVSLSQHTMTLLDNAYDILIAYTTPANRSVSWASSDPSVVSVNSGRVEAVSPGKAVITASMTYNGTTYSDQCTVTVEHRQERLTAPVLTVSETEISTGENFTASWTEAASDAIYYINYSGNAPDGSLLMGMGADTTELSVSIGSDWEEGTYQICVVARNESGQIRSNYVDVEVVSAENDVPNPAKSELQFTGLKLPSGSLKNGDRLTLSGVAHSNYPLEEITVTLTDHNSGKVIYTQTSPAGGQSYINIGSFLSPAVRAANYVSAFTLSIRVSDASGSQIIEESSFTVVG